MEISLAPRWLWVILGMVFVSVVISIIFRLINKCISRRGKHKITQLQKRPVFPIESNKYQETNPLSLYPPSTPPLPPRTQFQTAAAQSYENLAETSGCEEDSHDYEEPVEKEEQNLNDYEQALPDYEQDIGNYVQPTPDYEQDVHDYEQALPEYEQDKHDYEQDVHDYEQATEEQPDYVKVEPDEEVFLPPPPPPQYAGPDPTDDDASTEDYDDIGEEEEEEENPGEDYDDVG